MNRGLEIYKYSGFQLISSDLRSIWCDRFDFKVSATSYWEPRDLFSTAFFYFVQTGGMSSLQRRQTHTMRTLVVKYVQIRLNILHSTASKNIFISKILIISKGKFSIHTCVNDSTFWVFIQAKKTYLYERNARTLCFIH